MGGRCDQESDRQKDGAAERRMNDFEKERERKKQNGGCESAAVVEGMKERVQMSSYTDVFVCLRYQFMLESSSSY